MKYVLSFTGILFFCVWTACNNIKPAKRNATEPGMLVAADSMPIVEDRLNDLYFSIRLETTEKSDSGEYYLEAAWGYNLAQTNIRYPKGLEDVRPVIRRNHDDYSYIVGFFTKDDSTFHDYYNVSAQQGSIHMKYTKTYFLQ